MALVIFNIGWMISYEGQTPSDRIVNGGRYVTENKVGGEVEEFSGHRWLVLWICATPWALRKSQSRASRRSA